MISELKLNSLTWTIYTKHLWHDQYVDIEFTWHNCLHTCDTVNVWRLNSFGRTFYTKHLWHNQCVEVEFTCTNHLHKTLVTWSICRRWIHLQELFTLNTCDTINVWRLNSLGWTVYIIHLWHDQCVELHLAELFTLNTCDTISEWKMNSLAWSIYAKHLWHDQCWRFNSLAQTVYNKHLWHWSMCGGWIHLVQNHGYTKHLWHHQYVEVEFTSAWTFYTKNLWHNQYVEVEFTWHELVTLNTCDTINMWRLRTFYTKHELVTLNTCESNSLHMNHLHKTLVTWSMCWGWIHLDKLFTLNTC